MRRLVPFAAVLLAAMPVAWAEDPKPAPPGAAPVAEPPAKLATDEEAKAALERFKASYKGKNKGGALLALGKVNHPDVIAELGKHLTHRDPDLRTAAVHAFADLTALPGIAGPRLLAAIPPNDGDAVWLMTAVDSFDATGYRGGVQALLKLLKHKNHAVVKHALLSITDAKDVRALDALLDLMKELKIDAGYSWEGGEVVVDTGAPGTADQEAAEAAYHAQYGGNERRGRAAGRRQRDIGEVLLNAMKALTGQQFSKTAQAREWAEKNKASIDERKKALDAELRAQDQAAAEILAARKAAKK
jgi:hypothetical protein